MTIPPMCARARFFVLFVLCLFGGGAVHAAAADQGFVPRDLASCAAAMPADGVERPCKGTLSAAEVADLMGSVKDRGFAYSLAQDALVIAVKMRAAELPYPKGPYVCCEIQAYLDKVSDEVYAAKFRWNRMSQAMLDLHLLGVDDRSEVRVQVNCSPAFIAAWEASGKDALATAGFVSRTDTIDAGQPLGARKVTILTGPDCRPALERCTMVYMPDGAAAPSFVGYAVGHGIDMRRYVVVGVHNADRDAINTRIEELLFGIGQPRYDAFMRFVNEVVVPHAEAAGKPLRRLAAGYSNGGAWALDALLARPDRFDGAIIMSPAQWDFRSERRLDGHAVFVGAGYMEPAFLANARAMAAGLAQRGAATGELYVPAGHGMTTWINVWNAAIRSLNRAAAVR